MSKALSLSRSGLSVRQRRLIFAVFATLFILGLLLWGTTMDESSYAVDFGQKNLAPSVLHPFGTDDMGRDMFLRSVKGMSISLQIGFAAAFFSSCIALLLGTLSAAFGGKVDRFILWLVDLCMGRHPRRIHRRHRHALAASDARHPCGSHAAALAALCSGGTAVWIFVVLHRAASFCAACRAAIHHRTCLALPSRDHA